MLLALSDCGRDPVMGILAFRAFPTSSLPPGHE